MAVTDEAIDKIKEMIVSGQFPPGSRLPPEKDLGEALGLSRSSLREAVKALEVMRVLDVRRGDGTYVTSLEPSILHEAMSFVVDLHRDDTLVQIFAVRRLLEPPTAALAARHARDADFATMRRLLSVSDESSIEQLVEHDVEFHHAIAASTGNAYLASLLDSLSSQTVRARVWRGVTDGGSVMRTIDEHERILDALVSRDSELAEALMLAHVSGVERWLHTAR